MNKIPYVNLIKQWEDERPELLPMLDNLFSKGIYIGGEEVQKFEESIAKFCGISYAVALNSGTDALVFALYSLGVKPGDEVITPPNSFIASTSSILHLKAKPIFVDVLPDQNINPDLIEKAITPRTKAIMPVHLTGRVANMDEIIRISNKYSIPIIEDAAQAIGSKFNGKKSGSFGAAGCFSAHPLKNLNALGDAGYLTTNDKKMYDLIVKLRNHGMVDRNTVDIFGYVSRLDSLQAMILNFRLSKIDQVIEKRRKNAEFYFNNLDRNCIFIPNEDSKEFNTYHTFVIQVDNRDDLQKHLLSSGIETSIHYPIPIHLQPSSKNLGYKKGDFPEVEQQAGRILTLPINQYLEEDELKKISEAVNGFYNK